MKNKHVILIALLAGGLTFVQAQDGTVVQGNNLAEKLDWLNVFAQSNTSYIIEVRANESVFTQYNLGYSGKNNITITLRGVGANRTISSGFTVGSGATLVLDNNITLSQGVAVNDGGSFIMNNGSAITSVSSYYNGVAIKYGTFTMNGGTISGNSGRGVYVESGTFTMNGGTISRNTTDRGGGGVSVGSGTFTMTVGTISGNTAGRGGGVFVERGTFTMSDGTISGNTAREGGGVFV